MAPKRWANDDQQVYLENLVDEFLEAQKQKKLYKFWVNLHRGWFEEFPEIVAETEDLGIKIAKRKKVWASTEIDYIIKSN
jgi:hypothetical protein